MAEPRPVVIDPPPLNRFEEFPFAVLPFPFGDFERTDRIEPSQGAAGALPVNPLRFEP